MANNWTDASLRKILDENFKDYLFIIASNREPYLHTYNDQGKIVCKHSVGGVSMVFDSIMKKTQGIWVAYGGSKADKETADEHGHVPVPPGKPKYILKRVWMTAEERAGYYDGFANSALYFLNLNIFVMPKFDEADWKMYKKINKRFAQNILEEVKDRKALVWLQDYHTTLVAKYIREKNQDIELGFFCHTPWPTYEIFRICPWAKEILEGILSNDLVGFHRHQFAYNFLKCVSRIVEAKVDFENMTVGYKGRTIQIGKFPISIDYRSINNYLTANKVSGKEASKYVTSPYEILAVGVDRLDHTKGIPMRLKAIGKFLHDNPGYRNKFVYLGICAPSRTDLEKYRDLREEITKEAEKVNKRYGNAGWQPVHLVNEVIDNEDVIRLLNQADLCLVTPLDDGMNLVAKEFVAANNGKGALVLSKLIGAADELKEAYMVNPYDIPGTANKIKQAIEDDPAAKAERMKKMKETVESRNVFRWAGKFLLEMARVKTARKK